MAEMVSSIALASMVFTGQKTLGQERSVLSIGVNGNNLLLLIDFDERYLKLKICRLSMRTFMILKKKLV